MAATLDEAVTAGHTVVAKADLLSEGATIAADLLVTGGDVQADLNAAVRRHASIVLIDPAGEFTPVGSDPSPLSPYGNELKLYRGIVLDGGPTYAALGVFRIANPTLTDDGENVWTITGYDRSRTIARARFTDAYTVAAGTNYGTAIQTLIDGILPGLTFLFTSTSYTAPQLVFDAESDPWQACLKMADSIGCELFFDVDGNCVLRPVPDPATTTPSWTYHDGADAILLRLERTFDDDPGYNGAVVFGETTGNAAPVRAESWDDDPGSPTYYLGPYGKVPTFERSQLVTTTPQAQDAADAKVRRLLGVTEQVKFTAIPRPTHDVSDVIAIESDAVGLSDVFSLETVNVPLSYDSALSATTRRRKAA